MGFHFRAIFQKGVITAVLRKRHVTRQNNELPAGICARLFVQLPGFFFRCTWLESQRKINSFVRKKTQRQEKWIVFHTLLLSPVKPGVMSKDLILFFVEVILCSCNFKKGAVKVCSFCLSSCICEMEMIMLAYSTGLLALFTVCKMLYKQEST